MKKGVLLSGGVDSICLTYHLKPDIAYTVDYGQNSAKKEIEVSKRVCSILNIEHKIISVNCKNLGSGILVNKDSLKDSPSSEWWPYRNQLLVTLSLMQAIKDNVNKLFLASVKSDSFHKDGTKKFYSLINELVRFQEGQISIECITLDYFSHELATKFNVPNELLLLAHSCHISNMACGTCSGCQKQIKVRQELGLE